MQNYFTRFIDKLQSVANINKKNPPITKKILKKSLDYESGLEYQLENPDSLLTNKGKDLTFYDTMMLDDKIKGTIELKKKMTLAVPWSIKPASEDDKDNEISQEITRQFNTLSTSSINYQYSGIHFNNVLDNLLDSMIYGFKCGEKRFVFENGYIALKNIHFMHSIFFDFDYNEYGEWDKLIIGDKYGERQTIEGNEMFEKFIVMVWPYIKDSNMYGDSDLKEVYSQYFAKLNIFKFRNIYLQNYGMPIPDVLYDVEQVQPAEKNEMKELLQNWQENMFFFQPGKRSEDGTLHGKFQIDMHEFKSNGTDQYEKAIDQLDKQIARKLLLPDKVGFSESDGGSYNLAEIQFDALLMIIQDIHIKLENIVNPLIKQIVDYNWVVDKYPTFRFDDVTNKVSKELLKVLIDTGIIDQEEPWIRERIGIPELTQEEKKIIEERKKERIETQQKYFTPEQKQGQEEKQQEDKSNQENNEDEKDDMNNIDNDIEKLQRVKNPFDAKKIRKTLDENEADFIKEYDKLYENNIQYLISQIQKKKIIEGQDLSEVNKLRIEQSKFKEFFSEYFAKMYVIGKQQAIEEIEDRIPIQKMQLIKMQEADPEKWLNKKWIKSYLEKYGELGKLTKKDIIALNNIREEAFFLTKNVQDEMTKDVFYIVDNSIKTGETASVTIGKIRDKLDERRKKYSTTIARTNIAKHYNSGRMELFQSDEIAPLIEAYEFVAILDNATTLICESHDGQVIKQGDPRLIYFQPPLHFSCRSELVPIMIGENELKSSYYYNYKDKTHTVNGIERKLYPEFGSDYNKVGDKTFDMSDKKISMPAKDFGGV